MPIYQSEVLFHSLNIREKTMYNKEKYEELELEIIEFEYEDVITTSPTQDPDEGPIGG